jgi:hypothetical protein
MRLHSYVVEHDMGFAPNPFHGMCTLAACKPKVRKYARLGEYVIGVGTKKRKLDGRLIYLMKISEITNFENYWNDRRFLRKRPVINGSWAQQYGDNIYHRDPRSMEWIQEYSFHSRKGGITDLENLRVDTGTTDRVLIGEWFIYWGCDAPAIPKMFKEFIHRGIGNHYVNDEVAIAKFVRWAISQGDPGMQGEPAEWQYVEEKRKRQKFQIKMAA